MKKVIRLTESDIHRIVKNSVKRILKETTSQRIGNRKHIIKESANSWMGCKEITMIWHGEWSDPELEYNGCVANYWDVEDWCAEVCREEGVNPEDKNAFANWIRQNEDRVGATIEEMSGEF